MTRTIYIQSEFEDDRLKSFALVDVVPKFTRDDQGWHGRIGVNLCTRNLFSSALLIDTNRQRNVYLNISTRMTKTFYQQVLNNIKASTDIKIVDISDTELGEL